MIEELAKWLNDNQGVVSVLIYGATLFLGWVTGIFESLRKRPRLRLELIPGPTLCATFATGEKRNGYDVHRTAISLYLRVKNVGTAPTTVENVSVGYHWHLNRFNWLWLRYRVFWFWLDHPVIAMNDFQARIGDGIKIYPSLFQRGVISGESAETYLPVGRSANGVVYFEQVESWGGCFPSPAAGQTKVKIAVTDSFGTRYKKIFRIPVVPLNEAKKYNPAFGETIPAVRGKPASSPADQSIKSGVEAPR